MATTKQPTSPDDDASNEVLVINATTTDYSDVQVFGNIQTGPGIYFDCGPMKGGSFYSFSLPTDVDPAAIYGVQVEATFFPRTIPPGGPNPDSYWIADNQGQNTVIVLMPTGHSVLPGTDFPGSGTPKQYREARNYVEIG